MPVILILIRKHPQLYRMVSHILQHLNYQRAKNENENESENKNENENENKNEIKNMSASYA